MLGALRSVAQTQERLQKIQVYMKSIYMYIIMKYKTPKLQLSHYVSFDYGLGFRV